MMDKKVRVRVEIESTSYAVELAMTLEQFEAIAKEAARGNYTFEHEGKTFEYEKMSLLG